MAAMAWRERTHDGQGAVGGPSAQRQVQRRLPSDVLHVRPCSAAMVQQRPHGCGADGSLARSHVQRRLAKGVEGDGRSKAPSRGLWRRRRRVLLLLLLLLLLLFVCILQLEECYYGRQFTVTAESETTLKKLARRFKYKYTVST